MSYVGYTQRGDLQLNLPFPNSFEMSEDQMKEYVNDVAKQILKFFKLKTLLRVFPVGRRIVLNILVSCPEKDQDFNRFHYGKEITTHAFKVLETLGIVSPYSVIVTVGIHNLSISKENDPDLFKKGAFVIGIGEARDA